MDRKAIRGIYDEGFAEEFFAYRRADRSTGLCIETTSDERLTKRFLPQEKEDASDAAVLNQVIYG